MRVLEDRQPRHQSRRQWRAARVIRVDRPTLQSRNPQSTARPSATSGCFRSMIRSSQERNRSCSPVSRRSGGRIRSPANLFE